jgi:hypothetical protein
MESWVKTASLPTRNRQRKQSHSRPWNSHWNMSDSWHVESTASKNSRATHKTITKIDSCFTHGIVKHTMSHSRTRNHIWKLSHGWWMESTAHSNSRLTSEINIENRVIVDAWNRQWKLCPNRPEIISEKRVTVELEIATQVWVTADLWSRQRQRIHERRIKPIVKIDSCLTHGIVKHTMPVLIHKSSAKTE